MTDVNASKEPVAAQMRAITISREYGSGGGEIGRQLARRLGWKLIDHEVAEQVARALNVSEAEADAHDEHSDNFMMRLLSNLSENLAPVSFPVEAIPNVISPEEYDEARRKVVEAAVARGQVVIIGRGSQVLLAGRRDVLHGRIIAPLEQRISYVMRREGLDYARAQNRIDREFGVQDE